MKSKILGGIFALLIVLSMNAIEQQEVEETVKFIYKKEPTATVTRATHLKIREELDKKLDDPSYQFDEENTHKITTSASVLIKWGLLDADLNLTPGVAQAAQKYRK